MPKRNHRSANILKMIAGVTDNGKPGTKTYTGVKTRSHNKQVYPIRNCLRPRLKNPSYAPTNTSMDDSFDTTVNDKNRDETYIPCADSYTSNSSLSVTNISNLSTHLDETYNTSIVNKEVCMLNSHPSSTKDTVSRERGCSEKPQNILISDSFATNSTPLMNIASNITIKENEDQFTETSPINQEIISMCLTNVLADDSYNSFMENIDPSYMMQSTKLQDNVYIPPSESEESYQVTCNGKITTQPLSFQSTNKQTSSPETDVNSISTIEENYKDKLIALSASNQPIISEDVVQISTNVIANDSDNSCIENSNNSLFMQSTKFQDNVYIPPSEGKETYHSLSTHGQVDCTVPWAPSANNSDVFNSSSETLSGYDDCDRDATFYPTSIESFSDSSNEEETNDALNVSEDQIQPQHSGLEKFQNPQSMTKATRIRSKDFCFFCETEVLNFARHIIRNHTMEPEVQKILAYPIKSCNRKNLFTALRKKGNYIANITKCVKPMKKSNIYPHIDYLPCEKCLGFYSRKQLWKHRKTCQPSSNTCNTQVDAQNFMLRNLNVDNNLKQAVFPKMRPDRVSLEAKKDSLICAFGAQYMRIHREKHFINVTSRKMRELAKILIELKKLKPSIKDLTDSLKPQNYDLIVTAAKKVSSYDYKTDRYGAPTYAMNISTSLKQCCNIALMTALKSGCSVQTGKMEADFKTLIQLIQANWKFDVSSQACSDLNLKKWNKITIVPLASDLKILKNYLCEKAKTAASKLAQPETRVVEAYNSLLETIYCRVILLNRRRPGELQRVLLSTYQECNNDSNAYEEFDRAISNTEKMLMKSFKRIVIRGKRGRGVPVLFTDDIQSDIDLLISVRRHYIPDENNYLFAKPGCETPLCGYKVLEKYAKSCGAKNPKAITTTKLRKHLATLTQMLNLKDSDIEQLANFMGHTQSVHRQNYRLPDDVYQTAKISKLLLLMEGGNADIHKGKALDEIELDLEQDLLQNTRDENDDGDNDDLVEYDVTVPTEQPRETSITSFETTDDTREFAHLRDVTNVAKTTVKKKRNLVPWTSQQKNIVLKYFSKHIKCKRPPKRHECDELRSIHPDILHNKDWLKIKVFVQNTYTKK